MGLATALVPELTPGRIFVVAIVFGAAIGIALPEDVDKLQACWSALVGGLCLVAVLFQIGGMQQAHKKAAAAGRDGFRPADRRDLEDIISFTKKMAAETEGCVLPDAGARRGVELALRPASGGGGGGDGLRPRYWAWQLRGEQPGSAREIAGPRAANSRSHCPRRHTRPARTTIDWPSCRLPPPRQEWSGSRRSGRTGGGWSTGG
eukprot:SAG22_NODE_611_length_8586_cov_8.288795_2_plen_205_part_00